MSTLPTIYLFYTPSLTPIFIKRTFPTDEDALDYGNYMITLRKIIKVTDYDETHPESGIMSFLPYDYVPVTSTSPGNKNPSGSGTSSTGNKGSSGLSLLSSGAEGSSGLQSSSGVGSSSGLQSSSGVGSSSGLQSSSGAPYTSTEDQTSNPGSSGSGAEVLTLKPLRGANKSGAEALTSNPGSSSASGSSVATLQSYSLPSLSTQKPPPGTPTFSSALQSASVSQTLKPPFRITAYVPPEGKTGSR